MSKRHVNRKSGKLRGAKRRYMDEQNKQQTRAVWILTTIAIVIIIATIGILIWQRNADTERNEGNSYVLKIETPYLSGQGVLPARGKTPIS